MPQHSIEVKTGESLAALLKEFPDATVKTLVGEGDAWRVTFTVNDPETEEKPKELFLFLFDKEADRANGQEAYSYLIVAEDPHKAFDTFADRYPHPLQLENSKIVRRQDQPNGIFARVSWWQEPIADRNRYNLRN